MSTIARFAVCGMGRKWATVAVGLLLCSGLAHGASTVPFTDGFESYSSGDILNGQDPDGSHPWVATDAVVTNSPVLAGSLAAALNGSSAEAKQVFNDGQTDVWTDLYVQPAFGQPAVNPPASSSFAFYVETNGQVVAYNGIVETQLVGSVLASNTWVRFTVHSDYATTKWTLYVNGALAAEGLDFFNTGTASFTEFGMLGGGEVGAYVDDVRIQTMTPLSDVPVVSFAAAVAAFDEVVTGATVTVTLNRAPTNTVSVDHFRIGGTADVGSDFTDYAGGTLVFSPGQVSTSFTFTVVDDTEVELAETITFGLSNFVNGAAGIYTNFTYTINASDGDDDTNTWYRLPFYEPFEERDLGDLDGQRGWVATNAVVQADVFRAGTKAAKLESGTPEARHEFRDGMTNVWTDLYLQPAFGDFSSTNPPADSSFAFYVQTNGQVVAYDGTTQTQLVHTALIEEQWVRFTVHSDYASKTWDLFLDGALVAEELGFYDATAGSYTEFAVEGAGDGTVYLDDVRIQETAPNLLSVAFLQPSSSGEESVGLVTVPVTLSVASTNEVRVDHFLIGGTADYGADFTNYTPGTLVFAPGQTATTVTFTVVDDSIPDPDETVILGLRNFVNAEPGTATNFTYTIRYELLDETTVVSFLTKNVFVAAGVPAASIPVVLFPPQPDPTTVTVSHAILPASTATDGVDYTDYTPATLTFDPGVTTQYITFTVIDAGAELDRKIVLGLSDFVNASAGNYTNFTYTIAGDSNLWFVLPFVETFELATAGEKVAGYHGWVSGTATVQTDVVYAGSQAAEVNGGLSHSFDDGQTNVWTDMRVRALLGTPPNVPAGSTVAFYVNTNGHLWAYDGGTARDLTPPVPPISEGQWKRFTVHSDYAKKTWDLYVDRQLMAEDLAFYSESSTGYSEFGVRSYRSTNEPYSAYLDNVSIDLTRPQGVFDYGSVLIVR